MRGCEYRTGAAEAGLQVANVTPVTAIWREVRAADQVQRVASRAVTAGYLTQDTAGQWLDHLATRPFFASTTLFITTATAT